MNCASPAAVVGAPGGVLLLVAGAEGVSEPPVAVVEDPGLDAGCVDAPEPGTPSAPVPDVVEAQAASANAAGSERRSGSRRGFMTQ
jgi:hypothetical protein